MAQQKSLDFSNLKVEQFDFQYGQLQTLRLVQPNPLTLQDSRGESYYGYDIIGPKYDVLNVVRYGRSKADGSYEDAVVKGVRTPTIRTIPIEGLVKKLIDDLKEGTLKRGQPVKSELAQYLYELWLH